MEINNTTIGGYKVAAIFNGESYFFFNYMVGLVGYAKRMEDKKAFSLYYGNRHLVGGSCTGFVLLSGLKRFINKSENKYISVKVQYETIATDLADSYVDIKLVR